MDAVKTQRTCCTGSRAFGIENRGSVARLRAGAPDAGRSLAACVRTTLSEGAEHLRAEATLDNLRVTDLGDDVRFERGRFSESNGPTGVGLVDAPIGVARPSWPPRPHADRTPRGAKARGARRRHLERLLELRLGFRAQPRGAFAKRLRFRDEVYRTATEF